MEMKLSLWQTLLSEPFFLFSERGQPCLVDCDPKRQQIDPQQVAAAITPRTAAMLPVHLYGRLAPMDELLAIADKHNLFLLEDAAQAHGADTREREQVALETPQALVFIQPRTLGHGEMGVQLRPTILNYPKKFLRFVIMDRKKSIITIPWAGTVDWTLFRQLFCRKS